jgi:hypothetical protein
VGQCWGSVGAVLGSDEAAFGCVLSVGEGGSVGVAFGCILSVGEGGSVVVAFGCILSVGAVLGSDGQ